MSENKKQLLLEKLFLIVPFEGFSQHAFKTAAKQAGLEAREVISLFPEGVKEVIAFFFITENHALAEKLAVEGLAGLRVPEKIVKIILTQLAQWLTQREAIKRLVSYHALPWNLPSGTKHLYETVDHFWRLAGDTATDFNFYTKRMTLAGVYSATLLFWLEDTSTDQEETMLFLKRRLKEVAQFGQWKQKMRKGLG